MLSDRRFDLWADDYDQSVGLCDEEGAYPFAGYRAVLGEIYRRVLEGSARSVLDIGFGTGVLAARLYERGCEVFGQDFSQKMVVRAQAKMPQARLYKGDFAQGLAEALKGRRYDAIIATYSLHHLTDARKVTFLRELLPLLSERGRIYVGDVAFETRAQLEACRAQAGDGWDADEIYFVFDELRPLLPRLTFERMSDCAGLLTLAN